MRSGQSHVAHLIPFAVILFSVCVMAGCGREQGGHAERESAHAHEGEARGSDVELTSEQLKHAGITVEPAGPAAIESVLRLTAVVAANEDASVHVTPRVAGFVREIHKKLGDLAEQGEVLCEIESVEVGGAVSQYLRETALVRAANETLEKEAELFQQRVETQARVLAGAIEIAQRIFDREKDLQDKGISTLRPFLEADKELQKARLAKEQELTELSSQRATRLLQLQVELTRAKIELHAAEERLRILSFSAAEIAKMAAGELEREVQAGSLGTYSIRAPRSGLITDRHITYNEFVDTEIKLFSLQDLSWVWVQASVYEKDIAQVSRGQKAVLHVDAFPDATFAGRVTYVSYEVDPASRAVAVRIEIENTKIASWQEDYPLRPGMFGVVELGTARRDAAVVVPERAIVHEGEEHFVFVRASERRFERKHVQIREGGFGRVEIVAGLEPGQEVVTDGSFILKSMARSSEMGEGHSH